VEAERAFKKEVKKLGSALYNKGVQLVLGKIVQARKETKVKDTNVDAKFRSWAAELSKFMHDKLIEVGGGEGKTLAAQVPASQPDENIPKLIVYEEEAFPDTLRHLVSDAEAKVILKQTGDQAHHIEQMQNVPEGGRDGGEARPGTRRARRRAVDGSKGVADAQTEPRKVYRPDTENVGDRRAGPSTRGGRIELVRFCEYSPAVRRGHSAGHCFDW